MAETQDDPILPLNPDADIGDLPAPPPEIVRDYAPPLVLVEKLKRTSDFTLCGSPFVVSFTGGRWLGRQIPMYCSEPLCIETGYCTGPRFVPTIEQAARPRRDRPTMAQVVAAARESAKKATGKDDPRSDEEIARHVKLTTKRAQRAIRGNGQWTRR